ncbi:microviridin/marinostatin family tricyclic proteinase inhibitor [Nostoc sp. FACHB-892]|uniref:microviridin/marinostatin family tricyclic proteinase inhibitor n=1 Tax=Nostoc sp. FACHB-892 TaxID=2692843 RepID=UPI0016867AEE|nr:microviridin/marinostatin family tricyclic proteinase inhibitor [Nostoc sp. FACHB-892]MBD2730735.1 microviridin/marinostatin family tricyclic proteinase inhibitor [Nostoc sp. FACHB-892]
MSKNNAEDLPLQAVPFFARFLEGQNCEDLSDQESETISGGYAKKKSKNKSTFKGNVIINPNIVISPLTPPFVITNKYPSDGDDEIRPDDPIFNIPPDAPNTKHPAL